MGKEMRTLMILAVIVVSACFVMSIRAEEPAIEEEMKFINLAFEGREIFKLYEDGRWEMLVELDEEEVGRVIRELVMSLRRYQETVTMYHNAINGIAVGLGQLERMMEPEKEAKDAPTRGVDEGLHHRVEE